jgi:hypothetical protein
VEAFFTLGIALGLMAILFFGLVLIFFLMLAGTVFALVVASVPPRPRALPRWRTAGMIRAVPLQTRRSEWQQREEVAA